MHRPQDRTAALLAAFGCALAYLPAGRALAAVCAALPLSAAGQSFALHCAAAPLAEELVFRGAVQGLLRPLGPRAAVCVQAALFAVQHGGASGIAYALVLGVLLCARYALQSLGQKVLPLFSSVIELVGKVIFVLVFIPRYAYNAVILCEPIIWCFMAAYLVAVYRRDAFVYPRKKTI